MITAMQVGEAVLGSTPRQMTKAEAVVMTEIMLLERRINATPLPDDKAPPFMHLMRNRMRHVGVEADEAAVLMAASLCDRPAMLVMYVAALHALQRRLGHPPSLTEFIEGLCGGDGFPADTEMHRIWKMQKRGGKNWLDTAEAWQVKEGVQA